MGPELARRDESARRLGDGVADGGQQACDGVGDGARASCRRLPRSRSAWRVWTRTKTKLRKDVARTARELGIDVAEDGVAGAQMLKTRWDENERLRVKREGLTEEYEAAKVEAETAEETLKKADEELIALAAAIGVERDGLSSRGGAVRCATRDRGQDRGR